MNSKKKIIIICVISGFASLALIFFVIFPMIGEIKKDFDEFAFMKIKLSEDGRESSSSLKDFYDLIKPDFEKIDNLFIESEAPVELIEFWEKIAQDSKVSIDISAINFKKEEAGLWSYIDFRMNLKGDFPDILRFVEKIETGLYLAEITNLSIEKNVKDAKSTGAVANLSIKVFSKPLK